MNIPPVGPQAAADLLFRIVLGKVVVLGVGALVMMACSGSDGTSGGFADSGATLPLAESLTTAAPDNTGPADDLAPSQIGADTVPPPSVPGPCDVADLEFWTAQVYVGETTADAVIRVRNTGDVWCEPDISRSPLIDSQIEPDVWLDPGGWADLVVVGEPGCESSVAVSSVVVDVDGALIDVDTAVVASCGWQLSAFYPNEVAVDPCTDLETAVVDGFVLVRNASFLPCVLGGLIGFNGDGVTSAASGAAPPALPPITDLSGGDVVAFPFAVAGASVCTPQLTATATFAAAGQIEVADVRCGAVHELGPGRPWYGTASGPLAEYRDADLDVDAALAALDPFGAAK